MVSKNCPIIGKPIGVNFGAQYVTIATVWPTFKAKMKRGFYCHHGYQLPVYKNDDRNFTNDWALILCDTIIAASLVKHW